MLWFSRASRWSMLTGLFFCARGAGLAGPSGPAPFFAPVGQRVDLEDPAVRHVDLENRQGRPGYALVFALPRHPCPKSRQGAGQGLHLPDPAAPARMSVISAVRTISSQRKLDARAMCG